MRPAITPLDMRDDDYFNHNTHDRNAGGGLVYVCGWATRVSGYYGAYTSISENLAAGYTTPASVVAAWMESTGHRANILSTSVWEIGAGYSCCGGTYTRYWGQNFGKKSGVYPLVIDREAATTDVVSVDLYIYGTFTEMRLRNDNDSWGSWQTFSNNVAWTLNNETGVRTVSVEMRTGSPTYSSSDTIELLVAASPTPTSGATNTSVPPTSTSMPTNTPVPPTNTPTSTNTPVPPTSTPTSTNTPVPPTSTPLPPTSTSTPPPLTFISVQDAYVDSASPQARYGLISDLAVQEVASSDQNTYIKFDVTGLSGAPTSAVVRLRVTDGSDSGGSIYVVSNTFAGRIQPWVEPGSTGSTRLRSQAALSRRWAP